ncbi:hypothetical protein [Deinococcus cellulosilyticus]|uniref:Uncharacterized protein n=1 Tax=Deinococcus cellulosilyticus (strain DSM 18568 / NBRC 106333 / KACC 11606 / 5516J-15) TaxID=1223518 RepID=A0A511N331_DEIC1|nr:hypothetical protein [Deinococcus cellulosilyticus]GEM46826.1 hypothetical protein DC3_24610 [Deinococcus cellulosilyticus NBRC 106333 = KACC 11606]
MNEWLSNPWLLILTCVLVGAGLPGLVIMYLRYRSDPQVVQRAKRRRRKRRRRSSYQE